ncbi:hypothetical protein APICC_04404 [Apis cerana cerana]|uniref:Uncharacterized protein n=1 Tax=Apis cerana cerana TaxID=94128 RepID=A0A2A3E565_APICC|nr:hypothetical protein APICC_04404 [Apis cerana cerana]
MSLKHTTPVLKVLTGYRRKVLGFNSFVLSWFCKKGEDVLTKHGQHAATNLTAARLHEREFEKFYFTSMKKNNPGTVGYDQTGLKFVTKVFF